MNDISTRPDDDYQVIVENDIDEKKLLWLVNEIGEEKLRRSVAKYQIRYPGCKPFVSVLLKYYNLKVPAAVYRAVPVPVYRVYLLVLADGSKFKVGFTGDWPGRAYAFLPVRWQLQDLFDLDRSTAVLVGGAKKNALELEKRIKQQFAQWHAPSPWQIVTGEDGGKREKGPVPYGAGGHKEWFRGEAYDDVLAVLCEADSIGAPTFLTLRKALEYDIRVGTGFQSPWGRR